MKKNLSFLILLIAVFIGLTAKAYATDGAGMQAGWDTSGNLGVHFYLQTDKTDIQAALIKWHYDTTKLELISGNNGYINGDFDSILVGNIANGENIVADSKTAVTPRANDGNKIYVVTLKFKAKSAYTVGSSASSLVTIDEFKYASASTQYSITNDLPKSLTAITRLIKGDWDLNGIMNARDVIYVLRYISDGAAARAAYEGMTPAHKAKINFNGDAAGNIDSRDVIAMLRDISKRTD